MEHPRLAAPALVRGGLGAACGRVRRLAWCGRRQGRQGRSRRPCCCFCCLLLLMMLMLLLVVYGALLTLRMKPQVAKVATVVRMKPRVP